ncbi:MAG TPA: UdgX family uracil-DNA binding protein [Polyangia bacterium]|jgi:DNA polymerase
MSTSGDTGAPVPAARTLPVLAAAAHSCQACPLWRRATQTVFGEGPAHAPLLLVGEQPGDQEDRQGHPFVGPAGRILSEALTAAGIERGQAYVTNAVKHFKWTPDIARGKRRIHEKPNAREIAACRPWLLAEIEAVRPEVIVCLGATAAQSLLGAGFRVTQHRGQPVPSPFAARVVPTVHPSSILRVRDDEARRRELRAFTADLRAAAALLARH